MTLGSLFSGIGGFDLGLERAGFRVRWQVEIDPWCRSVLAKHWPGVTRYADVRTVGDDLEAVDCICGGFPCQPVSVAGEMLAEADERWLWPDFARIVRVVRPRVVIVENVPGLLVRGFDHVLRDLAACGYDAEWDCLPAAAFGAPHLRWRLFVVAYPAGARLQVGERFFDGGTWTHAAASAHRWWLAESTVDRVADGISARVDRIKALGNAVVPQVAEAIGRRALELF
jgi:DNA (cytosine-5)-methyltransferase 1